MGRKQQKKRTFGKKEKPPTKPATSSTSVSGTPLPPAHTTFSKYDYVYQDLKKIGISSAVILTVYALIFILNNSFNFF